MLNDYINGQTIKQNYKRHKHHKKYVLSQNKIIFSQESAKKALTWIILQQKHHRIYICTAWCLINDIYTRNLSSNHIETKCISRSNDLK